MTMDKGGPSAEKMEQVSVYDGIGNEQLVWMSQADLKKAEEQADRDFSHVVDAMTARSTVDKKIAEELLGSNKDEILAIARKENGDMKRAVFLVMEDALEAMQEYDKLVDRAVKESGYTGIVADGLRHSLMEERSPVFKEALRQSASPSAKYDLETAVREQIVAESAKQVAALQESVGVPEYEDPLLTVIRENILKLEALENQQKQNRNAKRTELINVLDRDIQQDSANLISTYFFEHPRATDEEMMAQVDGLNLGDFVTLKDVQRIRNGARVEDLHASDWKTEAGRISRENEANRMRSMGSVEAAPDLPADVPLQEWETQTTGLANTRPDTNRYSRENTVPMAEEIPDTTADITLEDEEKSPKKGFMQGLAKTGRKFMLGMMLAFGFGEGGPEQARQQQDVSDKPETTLGVSDDGSSTSAASEAMITPLSEEMTFEQDSEPTKAQVRERRLVKAASSPNDMERSLQALSSMPGKKEFQQLRAKDRAAQTKAALEDLKAIRLTLGKSSPAFDEIKRAEMKERLEAAQARWNLMKTIREVK